MSCVRQTAVALMGLYVTCVALVGCESANDEVINPQMHLSPPGNLDGIAPPDNGSPSVPGSGQQSPSDSNERFLYYLV